MRARGLRVDGAAAVRRHRKGHPGRQRRDQVVPGDRRGPFDVDEIRGGCDTGRVSLFAEAAGLLAGSRDENGAGWNLTRETIDLSVTRLREALAEAPGFAAAHYLLGLLEARRRRYGEAMAAWRRAAQVGPPFSVDPMKALFLRAVSRSQTAAAKVARGTQYLDRGKVQEAGAAYGDAAAMMPDYAEAHANLGLVHMLLGISTEPFPANSKPFG